MKKIFGFVILLSLWVGFSGCFDSVKKSNLKILYVGGSADWDMSHFGTDTLAYEKSIGDRMISFEGMLKQYFDSVAVVKAKDYRQEMSQLYDVTVMDGRPEAIVPRIMEKDAAGNVINYKQAGYLTENFDRPMLMIGELGETLGRRIGLKTDWYCLCLDADAHHFRKEHPIFNTPFPVNMTITMKPTPSDAYHYAYFADEPTPDSILMWKVQTKGYVTDEGFRVGMVSRPWGFEDSPDAEYISSGVCAKTLDAVAIGRHGNFLHWGFAASPAYMTPEAQTVLANAVVYIAGFAGQQPIARKYNDRIATRQYLKELKYFSSREGYEESLRQEMEFDKMFMEWQKKAKEKQAKGEKLTSQEEAALDYRTEPTMTLEAFMKRHLKAWFEMFGTDSQAYAQYFDTNRDYFYGGEGMYKLVVDEDVKTLGIPNNDKRLLDTSIGMLEKGVDVDRAKRILSRYTLCDFTTPSEWRSWYESNKNRLFFTEAGGWLFLVNTGDAVVGNDYHIRESQSAEAEIRTNETDEANPVSVAAGIINKSNGNKEVVVKLKVHPGFHIYANVAKTDPFIATAVEIVVPEGYKAVGEWKKPSFKSFNQNGTTVYENEVTFSREISGFLPATVKCIVDYQCCDAHICMPPVKKEFSLAVK